MENSEATCTIERGANVPDRPTASVVIPAYKTKLEWLDEGLESVRAQTVRDLEIILVDDGSPEPLRPSRTDDLILVRQRNGGVNSARQRGVQIARAAWVALLDSDDVWAPAKMEAQFELLHELPDLIGATTDGWNFKERGLIRTSYRAERYGLKRGAIPLATVLKENCLPPSTLLCRRDLLTSIYWGRPGSPWGEDFEFCLELATIGPFGFVDEPLTGYRRNEKGRSAENNVEDIWYVNEREVYEIFLQRHGERLYRPLVRAGLARLEFQRGYVKLAAGDWHEARQSLLRSIRCGPLQPKAWLNLARTLLHVGPPRRQAQPES